MFRTVATPATAHIHAPPSALSILDSPHATDAPHKHATLIPALVPLEHRAIAEHVSSSFVHIKVGHQQLASFSTQGDPWSASDLTEVVGIVSECDVNSEARRAVIAEGAFEGVEALIGRGSVD